MHTAANDRKTGALVVALVAFLTVVGCLYAFVWTRAPIQTPDSAQYLKAASDLRDFRIDELNDRPPGYPLLLVLTRCAEQPARRLYRVQLALHFVSVLLLALLLVRVRASGRVVAAFVLLASAPPNVSHAGYVLTESLAEVCLAAGVFLLLTHLERRGGGLLVAAGLVVAASALVRPAYQLLGVALGAGLLACAAAAGALRARLAGAGVFVALVPTLLVGGFAYHNQHKFGYFGLTPLSGFNLSTRTVRVVERLPDEYAAVRDVLIRHRDEALVAAGGSHTGEMFIWRAIPDLEVATGLDKAELSEYMLEVNLLLIRRAPLEYVLEVTQAAASYWMPAGEELSNFGSRAIQLAWGLLHFGVAVLFFGVVAALFGCAAVAWPVLRNHARLLPYLLLPLAIIAYTMFVSTAVEIGDPRYRVPTDLLIFFVVAAGLHALGRVRDGLG